MVASIFQRVGNKEFQEIVARGYLNCVDSSIEKRIQNRVKQVCNKMVETVIISPEVKRHKVLLGGVVWIHHDVNSFLEITAQKSKQVICQVLLWLLFEQLRQLEYPLN